MINWGYLAGMLDADGVIFCNLEGKGKTQRVRANVINSYKPLIEALCESTGTQLGIYRHPCDYACDLAHFHSRKTLYRWRVGGDRALILLECIEPYLMEKRHIAIKALTGLVIDEDSKPSQDMRSLGWYPSNDR